MKDLETSVESPRIYEFINSGDSQAGKRADGLTDTVDGAKLEQRNFRMLELPSSAAACTCSSMDYAG